LTLFLLHVAPETELFTSSFNDLLKSAVFHELDRRYGGYVGRVEIQRDDKLEECRFRIPNVVRRSELALLLTEPS